MPEKDELFMLIQSMDKNEKGYFKKFAGINGHKDGNVYTRLFDCITRMKTYNIGQIEVEFKDEKVMKHLSVTKFYLKTMIIRALRNYYEEQVPYIGKLTSLADTFIMVKKGLNVSAEKKILKERQVCKTGENFVFEMLWITMHQNLMTSQGNLSSMGNGTSLYNERKRLTEQYIEIAEYEYLKSKTISAAAMLRKYQGAVIREIMQHPLLGSGNVPLSNTAIPIRAELLARLYQLLDEPEKGRQELIDIIERCDAPECNWVITPYNYYIMHNFLLNLMGPEDGLKMTAIIDKCGQVLSGRDAELSMHQKIAIQTNIYLHQMRMYLGMKKPEELLKVAGRLQQYRAEHAGSHESEVNLLLMQAMAYVALSKPGEALKNINTIFALPFNERNDLLVDAYLLNIMVHIELGNYAIIKRQIKMACSFFTNIIPEQEQELKLAKALGQVSVLIETGNKKELGLKTTEIGKIVDAKKMDRKEYIKHWLQTKVT